MASGGGMASTVDAFSWRDVLGSLRFGAVYRFRIEFSVGHKRNNGLKIKRFHDASIEHRIGGLSRE